MTAELCKSAREFKTPSSCSSGDTHRPARALTNLAPDTTRRLAALRHHHQHQHQHRRRPRRAHTRSKNEAQKKEQQNLQRALTRDGVRAAGRAATLALAGAGGRQAARLQRREHDARRALDGVAVAVDKVLGHLGARHPDLRAGRLRRDGLHRLVAHAAHRREGDRLGAGGLLGVVALQALRDADRLHRRDGADLALRDRLAQAEAEHVGDVPLFFLK